MRRIFILTIFLGLALSAKAQQEELKMETFTLENGLKVILAEEHSQPKIYGGILVHAGSKHENPNATGVAHYFEHIMFKGTDRIGTTDWKRESLYLDSISAMYDSLHATADAQQRATIQKEINRLSISASQYAIPNEVDAILSKTGCTGVNAGTSYDFTIYYNALPSNQLENWMDIYVERFRNPIFRLFQSELEAVYEEKNMYEDNPAYLFIRQIFAESFGEHPYSRDVIGLGEHLKNPQPSEMQRFFETYYVANNMCLLLVGDFNIEAVKPLVEAKFGTMRSGKLPEKKQYQLPTFASEQLKEVKMTPLPMGIVVFPGVAGNHPDRVVLSVVNEMLSGGNGIFDKAASDGKFLGCQHMASSLEDAGINAVLYVPNLLQKHEVAERALWDCIDSLKAGAFRDDLFEAIKTNTTYNRILQTESMEGVYNLLLNLELSGSSYAQWQEENLRLAKITKEDIVKAANQYLDKAHSTTIRSKIGFPKKDAVDKPDWEHLEAQNVGVQSEFAQKIYANKVDPVKPQQIDFQTDVTVIPMASHSNLYATRNDRNNIFTLTLHYRYGEIDNPDLARAVSYFNAIGAGDMDNQQFTTKLNMLGGRFSLSSSEEYTTITISGFEENLHSIIMLVREKFENPRHDAKQIDRIVAEEKTSKTAVKNDANSWYDALTQYVNYGDSSRYRRTSSIKQWKKRGGFDVMNDVRQIFKRNGYATFSGNFDPQAVAELCKEAGLVREDDVALVGHRALRRNDRNENRVFYCSNKQFGQSNISIWVPTNDIKDEHITNQSYLFNEYFGSGMNSLMFQEIREFRSLGYSTAARFTVDDYHINRSRLSCFLGTQCDKTIEGIDAIVDLFSTMPLREDKFEVAKEYAIASRNSQYYSFRDMPKVVYYWSEVMGYDHDPRIKNTDEIMMMTSKDIVDFHKRYIASRPFTIVISGNAKRFDKKALGKYGKVTEVKFKELFKF